MVEGNPVRMPIIELNIGKNKVSGFKGKLWFEFHPSYSDFRNIHESVILAKEAEFEKESAFSYEKSGSKHSLYG